MPERPRELGSARRRFLRDWPLLGAALALVSLAFLPLWLPTDAHARRAALQRLRAAPPDLDDRARAFLARWPSGAEAAEVHLLVGRDHLDRYRAGEAGADLRRAAEHALAAGRLGRLDARDLRRAIALAPLDRDVPADAVAALREILDAGDDPEAAADLALALAAQAAAEPARSDALLAEALERVPDSLRRAELCRRAGKAERALSILETAAFEPGGAHGEISLARARVLARLGRFAESLAALDLAAEKLPGPLHADRLALARVELLARAADPGALEAARALERERLPSALSARLLAALSRAAAADVASALAAFPGPAAFARADLDLAWILSALEAAVAPSASPAALLDVEVALLQFSRLRPADPRPLLASARAALLRARRSPDPAPARRDAGERFARAAASRRLEVEAAERALLDAASAFASADRPERAADLYRRWTDSSPRRNAQGLLLQAESLRAAGLLLPGPDGRPGALDAFSDYVARAAPGDPGLPAALLGRAGAFAELGRSSDALADLDRVRSDALGLAPSSKDWESALLGRGRLLLAAGRAAEARASLEEYLERYAVGDEIRPGAVEAAFLLARARAALGVLDGAVDAFDACLRPAARDERSRAMQRDARFLRGELLIALGRAEDAAVAFAEGIRARADDPERLWGLAGRAVALVRLGRAAEARRAADAGRRLHADQRAAFDASFSGRGRLWWDFVAEDLR